MNTITIVGTIIGSAAFGAVAGKLLDAFVLSRINDKYGNFSISRRQCKAHSTMHCPY